MNPVDTTIDPEFQKSPFGKAAQEIEKIVEGLPMPTADNLNHAMRFLTCLGLMIKMDWREEFTRACRESERLARENANAVNQGAA